MSHMVMFRSAEGKPGYHQTESLDEAVGFVEHLRNQEQVADARIFRMEEVPIAVKTYYKVEVSSVPPGNAPSATASASPVPATAGAAASAVVDGTGPVPSTGREKVTVPTEDQAVVESMAPANGGPAGARFGRFNRS